jgi:hypothetical protein
VREQEADGPAYKVAELGLGYGAEDEEGRARVEAALSTDEGEAGVERGVVCPHHNHFSSWNNKDTHQASAVSPIVRP